MGMDSSNLLCYLVLCEAIRGCLPSCLGRCLGGSERGDPSYTSQQNQRKPDKARESELSRSTLVILAGSGYRCMGSRVAFWPKSKSEDHGMMA